MSLGSPQDVWEKQLATLFQKEEPTQIEQIINIVSMILYANEANKDMGALYSKVGLESFTKTIELFSGRTVKFMEISKLRDNLIMALCYYYREVKKMSWDEVKEIVPYELNTVSIGIKIKHLNKNIRKKLDEYFEHIEEDHE